MPLDDNALDIILRLQDELSPALAKAQGIIRDAAKDLVTTGSSGSKAFQDLDESSKSWFGTIVTGVATGEILADVIRAIASEALDLAKALPELALRGAAVDDVTEAFQRLTAQTDRSAESLLTTLRDGTHGTISDFDLMKRANQDLAAGLNLTDDQFSLLAKGAFALAQATGGSVKDGLDAMNDALVTGRAKAVALLTGKVDLKTAEDAFAKSLGVTVDELTAEGKVQADRQAILAAVGRAVDRLGEQTDGLDEKVAQGETRWRNYLDELGKTIATSPVVIKAIDGIGDVLGSAFGDDRAKSIALISKAIDDVAIHITELGLATVESTRVANVAWSGVKVVIDGVALTLVGLVTAFGEALVAGSKLAEGMHIIAPGETAKMAQAQQYLRDLTVDLANNTVEAGKGVVGMSEFDKTLDTVGGTLFSLRDKLIAAQESQAKAAAAAGDHAAAQKGLGAAVQDTTEFTRLSAAQLKSYDELLAHMDKETFALAMEHEKQWREERLATLARVNTAILAEFDAQVKLNAEWGLNAAGAVQVQSSALDVLNVKLAALHANRVEGISQEKEEQVLIDQYTKALYDEAVAQDQVAASTQRSSDATSGATKEFNEFRNTLVLGLSDIDSINEALDKFYQQLAARPNVGDFSGPSGVGTPGAGISVIGSVRVPTRDVGGPVEAGRPYYIGRGAQPELFIPSSNGVMVPNGAGASSSSQPRIIQVVVAGRVLAQVVDDEGTSSMRQQRQFPAP